jgi:hypothetical protein
MTGELQLHDFDGDARCARCGAVAIGPCARCDDPVCGDCCVLTEGGTRTYAICLRCDARGGRSLRQGWTSVAAWLVVPLGILLAVVLLLAWLFPS